MDSNNIISYNKIIPLRNICRVIAKIKSQQIEPLPHFGHEALFYQNNAVITGLMSNNKESKIDLFSGLFLYYDNEDTIQIDLTSKNIQYINDFFTNNFGIAIDQEIVSLDIEELQNYFNFVSKANLSLEIFRMRLTGKFTLVHLWPHGFDLSVEWFTGLEDQQNRNWNISWRRKYCFTLSRYQSLSFQSKNQRGKIAIRRMA